MGGTIFLSLTQISDSFGFGGVSFIAGKGHNPQGSPGHKHPLHAACTGKAMTDNNKLIINVRIIFMLYLLFSFK
tara:strand:- start:2540 stop:2761 length:222 start_codon:yes stop_codon:yes gene_type:complete